MQRMIMIPVAQYEKMLESYDRVMEELRVLREQLCTVDSNDSPSDRREVQQYGLQNC